MVRPFDGTDDGGDLVLIDTATYVDNTQPTPRTPASAARRRRARCRPTCARSGTSPGGRYRSAAPLFDGTDRLLVSWSQCRLLEDTPHRAVHARPARQHPTPSRRRRSTASGCTTARQHAAADRRPRKASSITDVVAGRRARSAVILDRVAGVDFPPSFVAEGVGILHIRSVYDVDGVRPGARRHRAVRDPAQRRLRDAACALPAHREGRVAARRRHARHRRTRHSARMAPLRHARHPRLRADRAGRLGESEGAGERGFRDQRARCATAGACRRARQPHTNWLQVMPGEELECNGCHNREHARRRAPHGRSGLFNVASIPARRPPAAPFPNTNPALFADMRRDDGRRRATA